MLLLLVNTEQSLMSTDTFTPLRDQFRLKSTNGSEPEQVTDRACRYQTGQHAHVPLLKHENNNIEWRRDSTNHPKKEKSICSISLTHQPFLATCQTSSPPPRGLFQVIPGFVRRSPWTFATGQNPKIGPGESSEWRNTRVLMQRHLSLQCSSYLSGLTTWLLPPLSKWFTMWGGGRSYCQETFFPTWFKHTQEKRGGVLRCGLQAGECKSVGSPTPAGRTGAALPAVHLPEGLSNQSPFKIRFHDHRSTVGNTCPNRKKSLFARDF